MLEVDTRKVIILLVIISVALVATNLILIFLR